MGDQFHHRRAAIVSPVSGEHVKQRAAQAVNVRAGIGPGGVGGLFGSHEIHGSHDAAGQRQTGAGSLGIAQRVVDPRQPHVQDFHQAFVVEQQIRGLDVAVDHPLLMGMGQALGGLQDAVDGLPDRQRAFPLHDLLQIVAANVFHDQVMHIAGLPGITGLHDIAMVQGRGHFHFLKEPGNGLIIIHGLRVEDLEGHNFFHQAVPRPEHHAHPAAADVILNDVVVADDQPLRMPLIDRLGLIGGELLAFDQLIPQRAGIFGPALGVQAVTQRAQGMNGEQTALLKILHKLINRCHRHLGSPPLSFPATNIPQDPLLKIRSLEFRAASFLGNSRISYHLIPNARKNRRFDRGPRDWIH
jgi:hypothetical protein